MLRRVAVLALAGAIPASASSQQRTSAPASLVFDGVTVVDVEQGKLVPDQRVVIAGNHVQAVGDLKAVAVPQGAQVVDARGKYLIPGLWDMHVHVIGSPFDQLFVANGVTGTRQASSSYSGISSDDVVRRRQEIPTGELVGPREIFSGASHTDSDCTKGGADWDECLAKVRSWFDDEAGFDMVKTYNLTRDMYFAVAAEARRRGKRVGGHVHGGDVSAIEASDSGASIIDHVSSSGGLDTLCFEPQASVERCRPLAERLRKNNTWWVPTLVYRYSDNYWTSSPTAPRRAADRLRTMADKLRSDSLPHGNWLRSLPLDGVPDSLRLRLAIAQQVDLPILAGTDALWLADNLLLPGFQLHAELAAYVLEGLTPLNALRSATLNPAKMWRATDSLGTVAPGKLADLVLLDADPLADITNTTTIRAVVANGRYFDRAALDALLAEAQAKVKENP